MTPEQREALLEAVGSACRERDLDGNLTALPAWHDLDQASRVEAAERAAELRRMEAALDPEGLSSTARAVLARISG
jgi:hypothetical protein